MPGSPDVPQPPQSPEGFQNGPTNGAFKTRELGGQGKPSTPGILNEPMTGAYKTRPEADGQSSATGSESAGNWPKDEAELNQRVQEWADRTKANEQQAKKFQTGDQGILNEPMSGAFKTTDMKQEDPNTVYENLKANREKVNQALRVIKQKLGVEDSSQLSEDAQQVFKAFVENMNGKTGEGE